MGNCISRPLSNNAFTENASRMFSCTCGLILPLSCIFQYPSSAPQKQSIYSPWWSQKSREESGFSYQFCSVAKWWWCGVIDRLHRSHGLCNFRQTESTIQTSGSYRKDMQQTAQRRSRTSSWHSFYSIESRLYSVAYEKKPDNAENFSTVKTDEKTNIAVYLLQPNPGPPTYSWKHGQLWAS